MSGQDKEAAASPRPPWCWQWVAEELSSNTYVNLMDQYRPAGKVSRTRYAEINRPLTSAEYREAVEFARELGLRLDERRGSL
jgi:putative pyruvate formate lyase activating enzyme